MRLPNSAPAPREALETHRPDGCSSRKGRVRTRSRSSGDRLANSASARREAARTPGCPRPRRSSMSRVAASSSVHALAPSPAHGHSTRGLGVQHVSLSVLLAHDAACTRWFPGHSSANHDSDVVVQSRLSNADVTRTVASCCRPCHSCMGEEAVNAILCHLGMKHSARPKFTGRQLGWGVLLCMHWSLSTGQ